MKNEIGVAILLLTLSVPVSLQAQYTKPVYISLPGPGNIQHLAYVVGKEKKFYEDTKRWALPTLKSLSCAATRSTFRR